MALHRMRSRAICTSIRSKLVLLGGFGNGYMGHMDSNSMRPKISVEFVPHACYYTGICSSGENQNVSPKIGNASAQIHLGHSIRIGNGISFVNRVEVSSSVRQIAANHGTCNVFVAIDRHSAVRCGSRVVEPLSPRSLRYYCIGMVYRCIHCL